MTHFLAIAHKPTTYYDNLQLSPWITGYLIILAQFFIYPAATDLVRRAMFRVFWGNHHMFILFLGALLVHGWWFWLWLIIPALLYLAERAGRVCRGEKPFYVKRIKWIPPVMEVQFCPLQKSDFVFKEGHYLYLRCPHLDTNPLNPEWHPFTISSAHGDLIHKDFVSCHIKIQPGGWTERLKNYFEDMNPGQDYPFHLKHIDEKGERQDGKLIGIDGQQLLCVDGPHSSPSQHYDAYRRCMVVGAGIGMTPCASILRGTLLYKWKRDFYPESLYFFWTVRHSELGSFQWFVSLITKLMTKHAMNKQAGNIGAKNNVQIHIYVTSYNAKANEQRRVQTLKDRMSVNVNKLNRVSRIAAATTDIGFTIDDLWERLHEPNGPPKEFLERVFPKPGYVPDNKVGPHIYVWNGRPAWDPVFMSVGAEPGAKDTDVGVCFCGAAIIAKQLQDACMKFSDPDKVMFRLHKENF